jgi:polysaccharide export outer membrane protein
MLIRTARQFLAILLFSLLVEGACTAATSQSVAPTIDYQIGPGDLLRIAVFDHPEFSIDARITQSGKITFPLLGQLDVAGDSTRQIE